MAGIYIHVPFCKEKCTYCDFTSFKCGAPEIDAYFAALLREIEMRKAELKDYTFNTVYFGGGTPSLPAASHISAVLDSLKKCYRIEPDAEITVEMNPGTADADKIKAYKESGINRFSIGLQSADDKTLLKLNRIHDTKQYILTAHLVKDENFSCDILIGLPDETNEDLKNTVDLAVSSNAKHVSMYALKAEEGTPMYTRYLSGELPTDDEVAELYEYGVKLLEEAGLKRYEVSNFCKAGFESKHNLNYWRRGEYIGFGLAAHSFIRERRFSNTTNLNEYLMCITSGRFAEVFSENIGLLDAKTEFIMLGLRTKEGINLFEYKARFKENLLSAFERKLAKLNGYLEITDGFVRIRDEFLFVQNNIIVELIS